MKAAMRQVAEINRIKEALKKTKSPHLKKDYEKNLRRLINGLKEYCRYRGFKLKEILME